MLEDLPLLMLILKTAQTDQITTAIFTLIDAAMFIGNPLPDL